MRTLKFGGSSVKSSERIRQVASIIKSFLDKGDQLIVVVSAFGGVTDQLINMAEEAERGNESYKNLLQVVKDRHLTTATELLEGAVLQSCNEYIASQFDKLDKMLTGLFLIGELTPRMVDRVSGMGELLSSYVIANFVDGFIDGKCQHIDSRDLIKTDSSFNAAMVDFDQTFANIQKAIDPSKSVHLAGGFIASNQDGVFTTLGRGGSDYSASIYASATNSDELEIWTDVDGVLTADPRKVKRAFSLMEMTYEEALEMSHFGAKVIHPPTIQPVLEKNIPIRIRNTFNPDFPGTLISKVTDDDQKVKGISSIGDVSLVSVQGTGFIGVSGIAGRLFNAMSRAKVNIILITQASSEHSICFAILPKDSEKARSVMLQEFEIEIKTGLVDEPIIKDNLSIVAVVGSKMKSSTGLSGRLFKALGNNGINVQAIAQGSSELNISVVIPKNDEAKAISALHQAFFDSDTKTINLYLIGTGLIGSTLLKQIKNQKAYIKEQFQLEIRLVGLTNSTKMYFDRNGMDFQPPLEILKASEKEADLEIFFSNIIEFNLSNSIVIDCTASPAPVDYYKTALRKSVNIVTANKIANSGSFERYKQLKDLSRTHNCEFLYETNVGAGLPVISTLNDLIGSGDKILKIEGVLSGSLSFIFNTYKSGMSFGDVVNSAGEKGYTEPDPREDLSGKDVARKALILAREIGMEIEPDQVEIENILPQSCLDAKSVEDCMAEIFKHETVFANRRDEAEKEGKALRMLASISPEKVQVSMEAVGKDNPFYNLSGSDNMIVFTTNRYKERPLVVKGPGAGAAVTAAGVFAELLKIGNRLTNS